MEYSTAIHFFCILILAKSDYALVSLELCFNGPNVPILNCEISFWKWILSPKNSKYHVFVLAQAFFCYQQKDMVNI